MSPLSPVKKTPKKEQISAETADLERPVAPEKEAGMEKMPEQAKEAAAKKEEKKAAEKEPKAMPTAQAPMKKAEAHDPELKEIQDVLQEGIYDLYVQMPPLEQKRFREEGIRLAKTIKGLLYSAKVNVKKIVSLIKGWLSRLPGINKFYILQESKNKIDKLLEIKKEREEKGVLPSSKK